MIDAHIAIRLAVLVGNNRIFRLPIGASRLPRAAVLLLHGGTQPEKFVNERACVGRNWILYMRRELSKFGRVYVHHCFVTPACQVLGSIAGYRKIQTNPNCEQEVTVLERKVRSPCRDGPRTSYIKGIIACNQVSGAPRRHDGNFQQFYEVGETTLGTR